MKKCELHITWSQQSGHSLTVPMSAKAMQEHDPLYHSYRTMQAPNAVLQPAIAAGTPAPAVTVPNVYPAAA